MFRLEEDRPARVSSPDRLRCALVSLEHLPLVDYGSATNPPVSLFLSTPIPVGEPGALSGIDSECLLVEILLPLRFA